MKIDPSDFVYDEKADAIIPKDVKEFDKSIEHHPTVHKLKRGDKRDEKVAALKSKVLKTLKVKERKKRDLSCESVRSGCSGWDGDEDTRDRSSSVGSRGSVRPRSDDEDELQRAKKSAHQHQPILRPPKIILSSQ